MPHCGTGWEWPNMPAWPGLHAQRRRAATSRRAGAECDENAVAMWSPFISVSVGGGGAGEDELLLIGGGYFLIEVVEVGVFLGIEECEVVGESAGHRDRVIFLSFSEVNLELGVIGPGRVGILRYAFEVVAGRQVIGYVILFRHGKVNIDRDGSLVLGYEGVLGARFEKEARQEEVLA